MAWPLDVCASSGRLRWAVDAVALLGRGGVPSGRLRWALDAVLDSGHDGVLPLTGCDVTCPDVGCPVRGDLPSG